MGFIRSGITMFAIVLLAALPFRVAADDAPRILLGSSQNTSQYLLPTTPEGVSGAMVGFPAATMSAFRGCEITEFRVDLDRATGTDSLRIFVADGLDKTPLAEWTLTGEKPGWNTFVPDRPLRIPDEGPLYIGYEVEGMRYLKYGKRLMASDEYCHTESAEWSAWTEQDLSCSFYAVITGDALPTANLLISHSRLPRFAWQGKTMVIGGDFINLGTHDIHQLTVSTWINGEKWAEASGEGLDVAPRAAGNFCFEVPAPEEEIADGTIRFTVESVNGTADASPGDNVSRTSPLQCSSQFVPRQVLMEVFSTENCTNCPNVHKSIALFTEGKPDIIEMVHHAGFLTDPLTLPASEEYLWFYPASKVYAPAIMLDRTWFGDNLPHLYSDGTPVTSVTLSGLKEQYAEATEIPAFFDIDIQASASAAGRTLDLQICGTPLLALPPSETFLLHVGITEDSIATKTQRGASGTYWHRHALRQMLTPTWGDALEAGQFSRSFRLTLSEEWRMEHCRVVAYVSRGRSEAHHAAEVVAAGALGLSPLLSGILMPCPGDSLPGRFYHPGGRLPADGRTDIYDLTGRLLRHADAAPAGIYLRKVRR